MSKHKKKDKVEEPAKSKTRKGAKKKATEPTVTASAESMPDTVEPMAPARRKTARKPAAKKVITEAEIGLRAYYIAEHRQRHGIPGDEIADWVEAERQLRAEAAKKS